MNFIYFFLFILSSSLCSPDCGPWNEEREVLVSFFASTSGSSWSNSHLWLQAFSDHCSWFGITCNPQHQVIMISLSHNGLSGTLPEYLDKLQQLQKVYLQGNQLGGEIPRSLSQLLNIGVINLSDNLFENVSDNFTFGEKSSLVELHMAYNFLSDLPESMVLPKSLQVLNISDNMIKSLPPSIGGLTNLGILEVSRNQDLKIPEQLWGLINLRYLLINLIGLQSLSSGIGKLKNLVYLSLNSNKLKELPQEMGNLVHLEVFQVASNQLTGNLSLLNRLKNLQVLNLIGNQIISFEQLELDSLRGLYLQFNPLLQLNVSSLPNLLQLECSVAILIPHQLPSKLAVFEFFHPPPNMEVPIISTTLTGLAFVNVPLKEWPSYLWEMELDLGKGFFWVDPVFTLPFPTWIFKAPTMEQLILANVNETLSTQLGLLDQLRALLITDSPELTGTIPSEIGLMKNLRELTISNCPQLSGTLPTELLNLPHLTSLKITNTSVSGIIEPEFLKLNTLRICSLAQNQNLSCQIQNLTQRNICDIQCFGNSIVGSWRSESRKCADGYLGIGTSTLTIHQDYSFQFEGQGLIECSSGWWVTSSGSLKVTNQTQISPNVFSVELSFALIQRELTVTTASTALLIKNNCRFELVPGIPEDISDRSCVLHNTALQFTPISSCSKFQTSVIMDFSNHSLFSESLWFLSFPCSDQNAYETAQVLDRGWSCNSSKSPFECSAQCGDAIRLDIEDCDDGNDQNKDGCDKMCEIEKGWDCSGGSKQRSECLPTCGDGLIVTLSDCDNSKHQNTDFSSTSGFIVLIVILMVVLIVAILAGLFFRAKRRTSRTFEIAENELELGQVLGEGKFGKVHEALWRKTTTVAVKVLKAVDMDESKLKEFIEEAELFSKLPPHPNIVQFLGITLPPQARIVTEFLSNGNLIGWMKTLEIENKPDELDLDLQLAKGISAGMDHLHKNKIVHRDLAARNILVQTTVNDRAGTKDEKAGSKMSVHLSEVRLKVIPKISDFGMSGSVKKNTLVAIRWAAPEIMKGGTQMSSEKSDVWAFGILVYEILIRCQHIPYHGRSNDEVVQMVMKGYALEPPTGPKDVFSNVMRSCLNMTPHLRPSFEMLYETLDAQTEQEKISDTSKDERVPLKASDEDSIAGSSYINLSIDSD